MIDELLLLCDSGATASSIVRLWRSVDRARSHSANLFRCVDIFMAITNFSINGNRVADRVYFVAYVITCHLSHVGSISARGGRSDVRRRERQRYAVRRHRRRFDFLTLSVIFLSSFVDAVRSADISWYR